LQQVINRRVSEGVIPDGVRDRNWKRVQALYATYEDRPLWLEKDADSDRANKLLRLLLTVYQQGLRGDLYPLRQLRDALKPIDKAHHPSAEELAEADVMLTAVYVALGEDLLIGQVDPTTVQTAWSIDPQTPDVDSMLARTLRGQPLDRSMLKLSPPDDGYAQLRDALASYRALADEGGWKEIPPGAALAVGDTAPMSRIRALRARLAREDYLVLQPDDTVRAPAAMLAIYDSTLAHAVANFQRRHGIVVDGILGKGTLASLNVPISYRIGQIIANMERYRWLPRELGSRYVFVNVPAFDLAAFDSGQKVLEMKVIVGGEYDDRATPAFADSMSYVEFAPYWNVPKSIAEKELWPKADADPDYLARNEYEIVDGPRGERIRQMPGPKNALGRVKFIFPNDLDIYLHDTPETSLFAKDVRAFSHGCIRVERPEALANLVLADTPGWTPERIAAALDGENQRVTLAHKIPVYIVYFTVFVRDGELVFGNDIYDRDKKLVSIAQNSAVPSPDALKLLDEIRALVD
jgi:murein L,D-transpeptidase YcbB/YkuD